jgi:hypothetical protein
MFRYDTQESFDRFLTVIYFGDRVCKRNIHLYVVVEHVSKEILGLRYRIISIGAARHVLIRLAADSFDRSLLSCALRLKF